MPFNEVVIGFVLSTVSGTSNVDRCVWPSRLKTSYVPLTPSRRGSSQGRHRNLLSQELKSPRMSSNSSSAARRSSTISAAITSGSSRLAESSRLSSLSQKMTTEIVADDLERLALLFALVVHDHHARLLAEGRIGEHQVEPIVGIT